MARFSGKQFKGAVKNLRAVKREEAEKRNALTKPENRASFRRALAQSANGETVSRGKFSHG